jgi:hypothetical protein
MYLSYFIVLISIIFMGICLYNIYRIKYPKNYYPSFSELEIIVKNTKNCEGYTNISIMSYTPISKKQFDRVF